MTASAAQLRAVASALTPELLANPGRCLDIRPLLGSLDEPQSRMVWHAVSDGNMALLRAVALALELTALRLEQEARNASRIDSKLGDRAREMTVRESHVAWATHGRQDANDIAAVVRAHWAKS